MANEWSNPPVDEPQWIGPEAAPKAPETPPVVDPRTFHARLDAHGNGSIHLGENDISAGLHGFTLRARANHIPQIDLVLAVHDVSTYAEQPGLHIPDATHDALIALGWTPPEAQ